ncbi:DNA-binding protein WhiA, partial [Clostridium paraputrificum]|uniref:DNA-binding protein WhiA n=1 Tax=Clostridium paraputrificum TaxID=29363 RepID=UPI000AEE0FBE
LLYDKKKIIEYMYLSQRVKARDREEKGKQRLMVKKSNSLKKNNIYMVVITEEMGVRDLLSETGILKEIDGIMSLDYRIERHIFDDDSMKRAYIRGAFIGGGSISN